MKRIDLFLIIALSCLFTFSAKAQTGTGLEFSRVVLITENAGSFPYISSTYTVPTGKVWKIESAGSGTSSFEINEINGMTVEADIQTSGDFNEGENLPIWLPEGTTINFYESGSGVGFYVSIIEFTVTNN